MSFPLNLIGELVAVKFDEEKGNIKLPDWKRSFTGTIIAVGPGCREVLPGMQTAFGAAVGMDARIAGSSIRILKEQDLDLVYEA